MFSLELARASRFVAAGGKRAFTSLSGNSNLPSINVQPLSAAAAVAQRWLRKHCHPLDYVLTSAEA